MMIRFKQRPGAGEVALQRLSLLAAGVLSSSFTPLPGMKDGDLFFGLSPSMCGKAPLFRRLLETLAATPPISI